MPNPTLKLSFHGQVIDHLGIQMYQSPVAAVAELISNAWDGDADNVEVLLPETLGSGAEIVIKDDGLGMTPEECTKKYLNIGRNRRGEDPNAKSESKGRPLLGRKGIGKFAGFGIAETLLVETVSKATGEKTVFELVLDHVRSGEYIGAELEIPVINYEAANEERKANSGTTIHLQNLTISRTPNSGEFLTSMARRFLIHKRSDDFVVTVNGIPFPELGDQEGIEFSFPQGYVDSEKPDGLRIDSEGWGLETVGGHEIRWHVNFYDKPISTEELRGVAVFSHGKLSQTPFFFNLTGGLSGQHGQQYLSGQLEADYIDELQKDLIATDRQQISWEHESAKELLDWGQTRTKELLRLWQKRRVAERIKKMEDKVSQFSERLSKLQPHEAKTIKKALDSLAQVDMPVEQFEEVGAGVLTAWEEGRLKNLICTISEASEMTEQELVKILFEADLMTALNTAEVIKTKIGVITGLEQRINEGQLENAVRDYISINPWLIAPQWETFKVEKGVTAYLAEAQKRAEFTEDEFQGRVDLSLSSGDQLLVIEFMRPGLTVDYDHLNRYERYINIIRTSVETNTAQPLKRVSGYVVADKIENQSDIRLKIKTLEEQSMYAQDWGTLLARAKAQWEEFLDILITRSPQDARLTSLTQTSEMAVAAEAEVMEV